MTDPITNVLTKPQLPLSHFWLACVLSVIAKFALVTVAGQPPSPPGTTTKPDAKQADNKRSVESIAVETPTNSLSRVTTLRSVPSETSAGSSSTPILPGGIRAIGPDLFYVLDKEGRPVPVPASMTIEDFQRLYLIDQQLITPVPPPRYTLQETAIQGTVHGDYAKLSIRMVFHILSDGVIQIPLGMENAIFGNLPQDDSSFRVIRYDEATGGYVAWIEAEKDSRRELALSVIVPIQRSANQSMLTLETPRATVSKMDLVVPESQPQVVVGESAQVLKTKSLENVGTQLQLAGVSGVLRLSWSESPEGSVQAESSLEVDSTLIARFSGPDAMRTDATFRVQSVGRAVDSVRIRLPLGAQVISTSGMPYQVTIENDGSRGASVAVFQLPEPKRERFTLQLRVEQQQSSNSDLSAQRLAAGGFFVEGAFRHVGYLALAVEGDWLPRWDDSPTLRPTADLPKELQSETQATVFRYYQQPFELPLTIVRKQTRISVVPTFVLDVQPDRIEMQSMFQVTVHGAPAQNVLIDFEGWEVHKIADNVALNDDEYLPHESPLRIPFASPRRGRFDLEVRARRKVQPTDTKLVLRIPQVLNASSSQPIVVIQPSDSVELNILTEETSQLLPARLPIELTLPASEQPPLCHRLADASGSSQIVFRFQLKPRLVQASIANQVELLPMTANVEQQITLDVRNAPLDRIVLRVPERLPVSRLRLQINGDSIVAKSDPELATTLAALTEDADGNLDFEYPVFELPFGVLGNVTATVTYSLASPTIASPTYTEWDLPLTLPVVNQIDSHEAVVRGPERTLLRPGDDRWAPRNDGRRRDKTPNLITLTSNGNADNLSIQVTAISADEVSSTSVQQAFAQTWATANHRRDRAVFRFTSTEDSLRLRMPEKVLPSEFHAMLDNVLLTPARINASIVEFDLSEAPVGEHVLEVSYGFEQSLTTNHNGISLPIIEGASWTQEFYWQLILPSRVHLVREPTGLISANQWGWQGGSWGRTPEHELRWLENWVGGSNQSMPPVATNRYLYTTFGEVQHLHIIIADRTTIGLVLTGSAFTLAVFFISFSWMRKPFVILLILFAIAFSGFAAPVPVLAILPPIVLGLFLAGLVPLLRTVIDRRAQDVDYASSPTARFSRGTSSVRTSALQQDSQLRKIEPHATTASLQVPQDV